MFKVIGVMFLGVLVGWLLRRKRLTFLGQIISIIVLLLLFTLGLEVGGSEEVMANLLPAGGSALVFGVLSTMGAVLMGWVLYKFNKKK